MRAFKLRLRFFHGTDIRLGGNVPKFSLSTVVRSAIAATLLGFGGVQQAFADDISLNPLERPDPKTVAVPNLAFTPTPADVSDYDEYYYFYKRGVAYEVAFADLDECRVYGLSANLVAVPPKFVPLGGGIIKDRSYNDYFGTQMAMQYGIGGVIGLALVNVIVAQAEQDNVRAAVKTCMAYKGYSRYGTSSDIQDKIDAGSEAEKIARMALIASGPQPPSEAIDP